MNQGYDSEGIITDVVNDCAGEPIDVAEVLAGVAGIAQQYLSALTDATWLVPDMTVEQRRQTSDMLLEGSRAHAALLCVLAQQRNR